MRKRLPIFIGILLTCLAVWFLITPNKMVRLLIERLDHIGYDLQLRTRILTEHATVLSPVAIIDIDDKSLKAEGRWPWSRNLLAQLTDELEKQGASVIAFDILFSEEEKNMAVTVLSTLKKNNKLSSSLSSELMSHEQFFNYDATFAKSLSNTSSVLALGFLPRAQTQNILPPSLLALTPEENKQLEIVNTFGYISNIPILQQAAQGGGFINIFADNDGIIRHLPLVLKYKGNVYPSLALQAVLTYLDEKATLITPAYGNTIKLEGIQHGDLIIPTDERGQVIIPFVGKSYTFPFYSATDVLHGHIPPNALTGKILFVGTSATGLGDLVATAIQNPFPGVEIQATLANGILQNNFSYAPKWTLGANIVLTLLVGLLAAFSFPYFGPRTLGSIIILLPPFMLFINNWIWIKTGLILSFLIPVMLILIIAIFNMLYGYLFETRRREELKTMFGQYVPEKHIDEMLKASGNYALHGDDRNMSVLFADIRSFTTISEGMSAAELVEMLNTFFTPMTEIIFKHYGTIDKYVGDLIMAFWGAPLKDKHHARHAIESALEMQLKVKELQPLLAERKWPAIHIGIGINSGMMSVGDMGSRFRRNYTVLGDQVNLASRVEGLTKFYDANIIVTENTAADQSSKFVFRKLDLVRVKGKAKGIAIYEVLCKQSELTPELSEELSIYHQALNDYFQQKWNEALTIMMQLQTKYPEKKIYSIYIQRINEFMEHPVPDNWDGIYAHVTK